MIVMQGAYGIIVEVESHPFELDTMLFMDWRDDHTSGVMQQENRSVLMCGIARLLCQC